MSTANLTDATARAIAAPIDLHGDIAALAMRGKTLFYRATAASGIGGRLPGEVSGLHAFDTDARKDRVVAADVDGYVLPPDGRTAIVRRGDGWHRITTGKHATTDEKVVTDALRVAIDPHTSYFPRLVWRLCRWRGDVSDIAKDEWTCRDRLIRCEHHAGG